MAYHMAPRSVGSVENPRNFVYGGNEGARGFRKSFGDRPQQQMPVHQPPVSQEETDGEIPYFNIISDEIVIGMGVSMARDLTTLFNNEIQPKVQLPAHLFAFFKKVANEVARYDEEEGCDY